MSSPSSPCIGLCTIDAPSGLCRGCGRSLDEIAAWGGLSEAERLDLMALLPERLARFDDAALDGAPADP